MAGLKLVCIAVVCMVLASAAVDAFVSCDQVRASLFSCIFYARNSTAPPQGCCAGIRRLSSLAITTQDRQAACKCMKTFTSAFIGVNFTTVALFPGKCGVYIPYKLSPNTDCNRVK